MTPTSGAALSDLGEVDMADPASLVSFVTWGAAAYPARHYFLDLWDHGLGWQGVILDTNPSAFMTTAQLASALSQIRTSLGRTVDIVGLDACRLTLEIMDELQPYADYFVGSQKDEPLAGWPHDTFLSAVTAAPLTPRGRPPGRDAPRGPRERGGGQPRPDQRGPRPPRARPLDLVPGHPHGARVPEPLPEPRDAVGLVPHRLPRGDAHADPHERDRSQRGHVRPPGCALRRDPRRREPAPEREPRRRPHGGRRDSRGPAAPRPRKPAGEPEPHGSARGAVQRHGPVLCGGVGFRPRSGAL